MGKVVLSEVPVCVYIHRRDFQLLTFRTVVCQYSGIEQEDREYEGVVVFSAAESLCAAALALLRSPSLRAELQVRAVEYMSREQSTVGRHMGSDSALSLLSKAMIDLRGTCVP